MNAVAAGLAATVAFVATVSIVALASQDPLAWGDLDPSAALAWPAGGLGFGVAAVVFRLTLGWRRRAAARTRRKQIAARARA